MPYGEFVNALKGEWSVVELTFGDFYEEADSVNIILDGDHYKYCINEVITETYSADDQNFCELSGIDFMLHWTIIETNNELNLEAVNLCGVKENYKMIIENMHHLSKNDLFGKDRYSANLEADLDLIASDSASTLLDKKIDGLEIIIEYEPDRMYVAMYEGNYYYFLSLDRR